MKHFYIGLSIGLLIALLTAGYAIYETQEAQYKAMIFRVDELTAQSVSFRNTQFDRSLLLAVEAFHLTDNQRTRSVLLDSVQSNPQLFRYLHRGAGPIYSVAFSPDGKILAAGYFGDIVLWDVATGKPLGQPLTKDTDPALAPVFKISFSPDGKKLAAAIRTQYDDMRILVLWDVRTGQIISRPKMENTGDIGDVIFSPDGKTLAIGGFKAITFWDVETDRLIGTLPTETLYPQSVFSPDGKTLATISDVNTISLWDVATLNPLGEPLHVGDENSVNSIYDVAFSMDGKMLITVGKDAIITLWDLATRKPAGQLIAENIRKDDALHSNITAFSLDRKLVASSMGNSITIADPINLTRIGKPLTVHTGDIYSMNFSSDGKMLASGGADGNIILWDLNSNSSIGHVLEGAGPTSSLAFSHDGKMLATSGVDPIITLWDMPTQRPIGQIGSANNFAFEPATFNPNGTILASRGSDGAILWDVATKKPIGKALSGHIDDSNNNYVSSLDFSPDGKVLAVGSGTSVFLWDVASQTLIGQPIMRKWLIVSVDFSPDGNTLAVGDVYAITLWDVKTQQIVGYEFGKNGHSIHSVAFSPDGKKLASSGDDAVTLWEIGNNGPISHQTLFGNRNSISTSIAFSPDGKYLVSGNYDNTIELWDMATLQPIGQGLEGNNWPIDQVTFSQIGNTLVTTSDEVIFWNLDPQSWVDKICNRVGRNFTRDEWAYYFPGTTYRATCPQWSLESWK